MAINLGEERALVARSGTEKTGANVNAIRSLPACEGAVDAVLLFTRRRRHTRFDCDWSSDVCSSDLYQGCTESGDREPRRLRLPLRQPPEPLKELRDALVAVEWGSDRNGPNWQTKIKTWDNLGRAREEGGAMVHSARSLGSAALNICAVASGSIDLYWEGGCWAWDVCAGWVILKEAGGLIVDGNPGHWDVPIPVDHRKYLAVRAVAEDERENDQGQRTIVEEFWSFVVGKMEYEH